MLKRNLGRSQIQVSAIGLGTNTIGGPVWDRSVRTDLPFGYGDVDQGEAVRAIQHAVDLGITFFDTADEYGCGQSERLLGEALHGKRDQVMIATKFGFTFKEATREITGTDASPAYIRRACEASLRRLRTDYIDLYQFHLRDYPLERAAEVLQTLEELVSGGKIKTYGWSTDDPGRARFFAQGEHCTAVQHRLNILIDSPSILAVCDQYDLASINRIPLLMGVLTGKFSPETQLPVHLEIQTLAQFLPSEDDQREPCRPQVERMLQDPDSLHEGLRGRVPTGLWRDPDAFLMDRRPRPIDLGEATTAVFAV